MVLDRAFNALPGYLPCAFPSTWKALERAIARLTERGSRRDGHGGLGESVAAFERACTKYPQAFRFMDLPKEIRLMVYEECDTKKMHYDIATDYDKIHLAESCATLIVSCLPAIKILQTCKTIRNEAIPIFQRNQLERVASDPIRLFIGGSCSLNYAAYVEDIVLLMAGLRIDSVVAPHHRNLGRWLHAHSWGPGALPSGHALQLLTPESPRKEHHRLIVCTNFGVAPSDTNFWRTASYINNSETVKLGSQLPCCDDLELCATGMVYVDLCLQSLSDTPSRSIWIGSPFQNIGRTNFQRAYVTFSEGNFVELEEWKRDWVEGS